MLILDASDDDETLKFYLERNIRLAQWVENPAYCPETSVEGSDDSGGQSWTHDALSPVAENWTRSLAGWSQEKARRVRRMAKELLVAL